MRNFTKENMNTNVLGSYGINMVEISRGGYTNLKENRKHLKTNTKVKRLSISLFVV